MKKLLFLFGCILLMINTCLSYSQGNLQFLDTNKLWSVLHYPYLCWPQHTTHYLKIGGEVTLNDTGYYEVLRSDDEYHVSWYDYGYIREDSTEKVFYRINPNTEEGMIYYGKARIGDTLTVSHRYNNSLYHWDYVISSIDTILLAGENRERISIHNGLETWIEGIGAMSGLLYNHGCNISGEPLVGGDAFSLLCFKESDSLIYINPSFNSCYDSNTGSEEIFEYDYVGIFPNPVIQETFTITFPKTGDYKVEIFGTTGRIVTTTKVFDQEHIDLSVNSISKGFYIIRVLDLQNNSQYRLHFIKP